MPRVHPVIFKVREAVSNSGYKYTFMYYQNQPPNGPKRYAPTKMRLKFVRHHEILPEEEKERLHREITSRLELYHVDYINAGFYSNMKSPHYHEYDYYAVEIPWTRIHIYELGSRYRDKKPTYSWKHSSRPITSDILTQKIDPSILLPKSDEDEDL